MKLFSMKNNKGLTLIELLVAIGIAAVIVTTALTLFNTTSAKNKVSGEIKNIGTLTAAIQNAYAAESTFTSLGNAVILAGSGVPSNMESSTAGNIRSGYADDGYDVQVNGTDDTKFDIIAKDLPPKACSDIGGAYVNTFDVMVGTTVTANVGAVATACAATAANKAITLTSR